MHMNLPPIWLGAARFVALALAKKISAAEEALMAIQKRDSNGATFNHALPEALQRAANACAAGCCAPARSGRKPRPEPPAVRQQRKPACPAQRPGREPNPLTSGI